MDRAARHELDLRRRDARDAAATSCGEARQARVRSTAAVAAARVARSVAVEVRIVGEHARARGSAS